MPDGMAIPECAAQPLGTKPKTNSRLEYPSRHRSRMSPSSVALVARRYFRRYRRIALKLLMFYVAFVITWDVL